MEKSLTIPSNFRAILANSAKASADLFAATAALEATKEFSAVQAAKAALAEAQQYESDIRAAIGEKMESEGRETLDVGGIVFKFSYTPGSFKIKDEKKFLELYPQFTKTKTTTEPSVSEAKKAMQNGFIFDPSVASLIQRREVTIVDEK